MASRKDNIKSLFSNTRTRVIIIFTLVLLVLAVLIGYIKLSNSTQGPLATAEITNTPGIQSIPGALNPTAQYAKLQEDQNVQQAKKAAVTGGSSIPTIIRTQELGEGVGVIGAQGGETGVGFATLAREENEGVQKSLWIQTLKNGSCSKDVINQVVSQGAQLTDLKEACGCIKLKDTGYSLSDLQPICDCKELKAAGYNARQLKEAGYTAKKLRACGFDACELRNAGFTAQEMKDGGFSDGELKGAGYSDAEIKKASGLPDGITAADIRNAGCSVKALTKLRQAGVSAAAIRRISGCSAEQLKAAGYSVEDLKDAGFTAAELKRAGFNDNDLKKAGFSDEDIKKAAKAATADCSVAALKKARAEGVSALTIRQTLGCSAQALKDAGYTAKELKDAGYTAAELKAAGFNAKELKDAGFDAAELKNAGFSAGELKDAGFSANDLKNAGFSAGELKNAGYSAEKLKALGFSAKDLKDAGFTAKQLKNAGFTDSELKDAGFAPEETSVAGTKGAAEGQKGAALAQVNQTGAEQQSTQAVSNADQLQAILNKQNQQFNEQKYQQKIQQRTSEMLAAANQSIQDWKKVSTQVYAASSIQEKPAANQGATSNSLTNASAGNQQEFMGGANNETKAIIKTGDILFAVIDTSVNSDEPGPILATIVTGKLKGTKLIGSFNLPANANKMVITFNTMSVPGAAKTTSISAYAIDPNTARTALSSRTDHHYLMRYGSLFAASFLEGFGNAFQSADTTVTIGGTGGGNNITVQNGIGRSTLQNAVIGLATLGKTWGQQAQQVFNTPTTVEVYSGTGVGILFTQDVTTI